MKQISLSLNIPADNSVKSVDIMLQAFDRNEDPLMDVLDQRERSFVYHTEHDGDIVLKPTATCSKQPVVTSEQCTGFTTT